MVLNVQTSLCFYSYDCFLWLLTELKKGRLPYASATCHTPPPPPPPPPQKQRKCVTTNDVLTLLSHFPTVWDTEMWHQSRSFHQNKKNSISCTFTQYTMRELNKSKQKCSTFCSNFFVTYCSAILSLEKSYFSSSACQYNRNQSLRYVILPLKCEHKWGITAVADPGFPSYTRTRCQHQLGGRGVCANLSFFGHCFLKTAWNWKEMYPLLWIRQWYA